MTRLWLDANVLLRFLTGDPPALARRAARLMRRADEGEVTLHLSELILAEVVWVLRSFYERPMTEVADLLTRLLSAPGITVANRERSVHALELARDHNVDYIDATLALEAAAHHEAVATFDKKDFQRLPGEWLQPE